jgi:flagellar basal-body rod protein FlgF
MNDLIWLAMSGAQALAHRQESTAHNLANANTVGYRADRSVFRSVPVESAQGSPTRVFALEASAAFDPSPGPVTATGRSLDVAIVGEGWFVVQSPDGGEALTRNGRLEVGPEGALQVAGGRPVLGDGGPLVVPPNAQVGVGADGTVSARVEGQPPVQLGRLRLVNPPPAQLVRGEDGLMRSVSPDPVPDDPAVRVAEGALEGSNVNVVESMVGMISLARQYEVQMRLLQNAENNEQRATQLLSPT